MSDELLPISDECKKKLCFSCKKVVIQEAAQTACSCKCHSGVMVHD